MIIATLQFELLIPQSESLKDKRRVVKSLKDRLHREHMISIAEVGALDMLNTAMLGVALVSNSAQHASGVLDRVVEKLKGTHDARLGEVRRSIVPVDQISGLGDPSDDADPIWTEEEQRMLEEAASRELTGHDDPGRRGGGGGVAT